jgi:hypothetical protein
MKPRVVKILFNVSTHSANTGDGKILGTNVNGELSPNDVYCVNVL